MAENTHFQDEKARVLVVDDSRVMRKAISKILGNDFELIEAEDGEVGWEALKNDGNIQVVISDVQMPRLDGYSMICRIRAADESRVRDVPIIVSTAADDDITRERAFACGANDFITKPIDAGQLVSLVRNYAAINGDERYGKEAEYVPDEASSIDPLTQLSGRRFLMDRGAKEVAAALQNEQSVSLVRMDVDGFDEIRAKHGDEIADNALIWLGSILSSRTRKDLTVARTGSAKFAILVPGLARAEAAILSERLRAAIAAEPFTHNGVSFTITVSIGLATLGRDHSDSIDDLYALAERRVSAARAAGGDQLVVNDNQQDRRIDETVIEQPDIDTALKMLANRETGKLGPYAPDLALSVIPLLEFCNENLGLGLEYEISQLKEKLTTL